MKKTIFKNLEAVACIVIGIMLFLSSLTLFQEGEAPSIAIASFSVIIGLYYISVGIIYLLQLVYSDSKLDILNRITYLAFPFYVFMKSFIILCSGSANNFAAVGWIKIILELCALLLLFIFYFLSFGKKESRLFTQISRSAFYLLIALLIVDLVFSNNGIGRTIGEIQITALLNLVLYTIIGISEFRREDNLKENKKENNLNNNENNLNNNENKIINNENNNIEDEKNNRDN